MAFSLEDHLASMERDVSNGLRDGQKTIIVKAARHYPTDVLDLWDALTRPERLSRWFLPVSGDLRLGGHYQFQGNAGGTILECDAPRRVEATWEHAGGLSWVRLLLVPETDGTRLELEHEAHPIPGFTDKFGPGAVGVGWDLGFLGLARHLDDPTSERPPEAAEGWQTSPEALSYYRASSTAWGQADMDAGTPAEQAAAAAEATRAFYSGESQGMGTGTTPDGA